MLVSTFAFHFSVDTDNGERSVVGMVVFEDRVIVSSVVTAQERPAPHVTVVLITRV